MEFDESQKLDVSQIDDRRNPKPVVKKLSLLQRLKKVFNK